MIQGTTAGKNQIQKERKVAGKTKSERKQPETQKTAHLCCALYQRMNSIEINLQRHKDENVCEEEKIKQQIQTINTKPKLSHHRSNACT